MLGPRLLATSDRPNGGESLDSVWGSEAVWNVLVLSSRAGDRPPTLLHMLGTRGRGQARPHHLSVKYSSRVLSGKSIGKQEMSRQTMLNLAVNELNIHVMDQYG